MVCFVDLCLASVFLSRTGVVCRRQESPFPGIRSGGKKIKHFQFKLKKKKKKESENGSSQQEAEVSSKKNIFK